MKFSCNLHSSPTKTTFLNMRLLQSPPPTLLSLLAIILSSTHTAIAKPLPREDGLLVSRDGILESRDCAIKCGWDGLICCEQGQSCYTNLQGQAECGVGISSGGAVTPQNNAVDGGQWQLYTTTYVETDLVTRTSVYSSLLGAATYVPAPTVQELAPVITDAPCRGQYNEIPCGGICCAVGQYCAYQGQCAAVAGVVGDPSSSYFSLIMNPETGSAFIRPTSIGFYTITSTGVPTATVAFLAPMATGAGAGITATPSNNGLSGGAIAGIVIGVLLGLFLLFLFCAYFCFKGVFNAIAKLFGGGRKRTRRTETYIEERHSTHGGGGGRTWFGRPSQVKPPKKKDAGVGGFLGAAGALAALAVFLGLKRRAGRDKSSYGTGSSYTYSDYTSSSRCSTLPQNLISYSNSLAIGSASSDRRTRNTRQSRR